MKLYTPQELRDNPIWVKCTPVEAIKFKGEVCRLAYTPILTSLDICYKYDIKRDCGYDCRQFPDSYIDFSQIMFELPENFCIRGCEELNEWFSENIEGNHLFGNCKYFVYFTETKSIYGLWDCSSIIEDKTEITFSQFKYFADKIQTKKTKETPLPDKWAIKVTEKNLAIVGKWFNKNKDEENVFNYANTPLGRYLHFPSIFYNSHYRELVTSGYTEITDNQFYTNILKKDDKRKIIGRKVPLDMFGGKIKKGDPYIPYSVNSLLYVPKNGGFCFDELTLYSVPSEITEKTWEPIYEEEFKAGDYVVITDFGRVDVSLDDAFSLNNVYILL